MDKAQWDIQDERTKALFNNDQEAAEEFHEGVRELAKTWPIWGFRCSGAPYVTNRAEIDRELARRKERHGA